MRTPTHVTGIWLHITGKYRVSGRTKAEYTCDVPVTILAFQNKRILIRSFRQIYTNMITNYRVIKKKENPTLACSRVLRLLIKIFYTAKKCKLLVVQYDTFLVATYIGADRPGFLGWRKGAEGVRRMKVWALCMQWRHNRRVTRLEKQSVSRAITRQSPRLGNGLPSYIIDW